MPYNDELTAAALTGVEIPLELIENARAIIDTWTPFRWEPTKRTDTFSGNGTHGRLYLRMPVIGIESLTVDGVEQVEGVDFHVSKPIGKLSLVAGQPEGYDNIVAAYTYGYTTDDEAYPLVKGAEARIALYLKKNPACLDEITFTGTGTRVSFADEQIERYLFMVPRLGNWR